MRKRIKTASGRTTKTTPWLLAMFTAVALAVTSVVPSLQAENAMAAPVGVNDKIILDGAICENVQVQLSAKPESNHTDSGVATYVGRNMYIGKPHSTTISSAVDITGSYAAEAEGLTYVGGKLAMNNLKTSWRQAVPGQEHASWQSAGFRWGTVGFGAQFRPAAGSYALAVAGGNSGLTLSNGGSVAAFTRGSFVGSSGNWNANKTQIVPITDGYKAKLNGSSTNIQDPARYVWDGVAGSTVPTWSDRPSVVGNPYENWGSQSLVEWGATPAQAQNVNNLNLSDFGRKFSVRSARFSKLPKTGEVDTTSTNVGDLDINDTSHKRSKYVGDDSGRTLSYTFYFNGNHKEKLITFEGKKNPHLEVFELDASAFDDTGYSGVSYAFTNIADTASVIINVKGTPQPFHNGWRFWWNGTQIDNNYTSEAYSHAASHIMWNFHEATNLEIEGGSYNGQNNLGVYEADDPAAAMLGSIMVPKGSFISHVTTNGRVYVGGDFMMYNPTAINRNTIGNNDLFWDGDSASVIDMDQERHNLPFNFPCSVISWEKVGRDRKTLLGGTTWAVYATIEDAKAQQNELRIVQDNGAFDEDKNNGKFKVKDLDYASNYFLRERATVEGYRLNTNIYHIQTAKAGDEVNKTIAAVYTSSGASASDTLLNENDQIINLPIAEIEWGKYDENDTEHTTPLAGSSWRLIRTFPEGNSGDCPAPEGCIIVDNATRQPENPTPDPDKPKTTVIYLSKKAHYNEHGSDEVGDMAYLLYKLAGQNSYTSIEPDKESAYDGYLQYTVKNPDSKSVTLLFKSDAGTEYNAGVSKYLKLNGSDHTLTEPILTVKENDSFSNAVPEEPENPGDPDSGNTGSGDQYRDKNSLPGLFKVEDLDVEATYTLQEVTAPDGYFVNLSKYTFTVDQSGKTHWQAGGSPTLLPVYDTPTHYEWEKIDAGYDPNKPNTNGDRLAGTTWKLEVFTKTEGAQTGKYDTAEGFDSIVDCTAGEGNESQCTGPDKDPVGGKFKIEKLKIGKYRLQETHAPSGYIVEAGKYYYFEIDAKSGTVLQAGTQTSFDKSTGAFKAESATSRSGGSGKVYNFRKPGTAGWEKVTTDGETKKHLKGAEWSMRYQSLETTGEGENQKPVTDITFKITDSNITCAVTGTETACSGNDLAWATSLTNKATDDGKYSFEGLPWGTYTVTETKAPDGYNLDSTPHEFVIRPLTADDNANGTSLGTEGDNHFTVDLGPIENTPGVILPETGGEGSSWVVMLGFALTAIAMIGCGLALSRHTA